MDVRWILIISTVLQFAASIMSLRLIRLTGRLTAWLLISAGLFLMALRRSITFLHLISTEQTDSLELSAEWIALATSTLVLIGIVRIAPLFRSIKRSADALRESEKKFRTLFEDSKEAIYITSRDGRIIDMNSAGLDLFGYSREEMIGMDVLKIYAHPEERTRFQQQIEQLGAVKDYQVKFVKKNGMIMDCLLASSLQYSDDGTVFAYRGIIRDVSERNLMMAMLEAERQKFFSLLDGLPAFVDLRDSNYSFVFTNRRFRETFGDPGEKACYALFLGRDVPCESCTASRVFETGEPQEFEWTYCDGQTFRINQYPYEEVEGSPLVLELGVDVTERRKAEEALRQSESKFRSLAETAASAIVIYQDERFRYINPAAETITGYTREELLNMSYLELIHPDFNKILEECEAAWLSDENVPPRYEFKIVTKTGGVRWLDAAATRIEYEGEPAGLATILDVTDRKRAEGERAQLVAAIEQAAEGVLIIDQDETIVYANPAFEQMSEYTRERLIGSPLSSIGHEYIEERFLQAVKACLARGEAWTGHFTGRKISGSAFKVEASISPVRGESGMITSCVVIERDVTIEAKLERQLIQAQKMESLGTLAGGIAHDFNNILGIIFGFTDVALLRASQGDATLRYLEGIQKAAYRAKDLVQQILAFSRQGEREWRPVLLGPIVQEALALLRASLPSTIEIRENISSTHMSLGDPTQIHQVLMNLCANASHAMKDCGGILGVSLVDVDLDEDFTAKHPDVEPGPYVKLTVSDTGHGMDAATMERIFDPYFTTKGQSEGTGLGLAVVHGIVNKHGGIITVYSESGKGSSFNVFLPKFAEETAGMKEGIEKSSRQVPRGNERILFIDDEKMLCEVGRSVLERLGYNVETRTSSIEALEALRIQPDKFDLVITDLTMPHLTGLELAREMHRVRSDIPIILCTGFSGMINQEMARAAGICRLLVKPLILDDLACAIRSALDEKTREVPVCFSQRR